MLLLYPVTLLSQGLHIRKYCFQIKTFFYVKKQTNKKQQESFNTSHDIWIHFLLNFGTVLIQ